MELIQHLGDFLRSEMEKRQMSAHSFSEFMGVSHTTVIKFLDFGERDTGYPSIDFLIKLAKATETDIRDLMALIVPGDVITTRKANPEFEDMSIQIAKLPADYRRLVKIVIDAGLKDT